MGLFESMFAESTIGKDVITDDRDFGGPSARIRVFSMAGMRLKLEAQLTKARKSLVTYYNKKKHKPQAYNIGDKKHLNSKNTPTTKFEGPRESWKINNVSYVSSLEPLSSGGRRSRAGL